MAKITIPAGLTVALDVRKVVGKAGRAAATAIKARLRSRKGASGSLPMPEDHDNQGLQRTGTLIDSIRWSTQRGSKGERGSVFPGGKRQRPKVTSPKTATRNAAIMGILLATKPEIAKADPMGVDDDLRELIKEKALQAIRDNRVTLTKLYDKVIK